MNIPEEFGKYLLLKKLTEDPLGETFRSGRVGTEGIEQVVLLRVFNGKGMDGEKLWQQVSGRGAVQQALRSPNIGTGVDLGRVRSYPYAAYDYISGKNLATLFAQAAKQFSPIPTDHALLITERIALALAAAYETRVQDQRVQHGFVTPHLIMISNEGETRLLGFEVAPGLRALAAAGWSDPEIQPYLSPETAEGAALGRSDDVWSLGAILYELLTGERLPAAPAEGYGPLIDRAELANEGTPLPPAIVALLKKSLVARDQRIADAVTWHKTLSKLMIDGHYSPTTFNLAFFMHNLFRDEIERESQEIQAEKKLELPHRTATVVAAPVPAAASADMREKTGVREGTLPGTRVASAQAAPSSKAPLFIGLAAAVLVGAGVGAWILLGRSGGDAASQQAAGPAAPMTQPASVPINPQQAAPVPAGPTQEEIQAQIKTMLDAQSQDMEAKLKAQYDQRLKDLQKQLEERQRRDEQVKSAPAVPAPQVEEPTPAPVVSKPAAEPPAPAPSTTQPAQVPAPAVEKEQKPAASPPQTTPSNPPVSSPPAAAPARKQVQYGDLVPAGEPGVTAPKLKGRLEPRYPPAAQRMNKSASVDVKVLVDEKGKVLEAERVGPKAGFGFDESALEAARRATFQPATTRDGVRVKMWYTVRVAFQPGK